MTNNYLEAAKALKEKMELDQAKAKDLDTLVSEFSQLSLSKLILSDNVIHILSKYGVIFE